MSAGSLRITFRASRQLLRDMEGEILKHNAGPCNVPQDISTFIRKAVRHEIQKRQRSRAHRHPTRQHAEEVWPDEIVCLTDQPSE
jgi:hypothetical protein